MNLEQARLEAACELITSRLAEQDLPEFMQKRWARALAKAAERLVAQPYFSWQNDYITLVSLPKTNEIDCKFYQASREACRRVDKSGLCQAFFEGFPCWHRAAFLLLQIYYCEHESERLQIDFGY